VAWQVIFSNSNKDGFGGVPLEELHQFGESRARSTLLVDQIHGGAGRGRSVWPKKVDLDLVLMNLELVNVYQIGPTSHLHIGVYQAHCVVH
jgi:hypothetical protein